MHRTGVVDLGLHTGPAPHWLLIRMRKLAKSMLTILINEYGPEGMLTRLADPFWFQALSAVLGFDFDSSGVTPVTCAVLKSAIAPEEHGFGIAGGKEKRSKHTPAEARALGEKFGLTDAKISRLVYSSRMAAKVDNAAIQAGYPLYHHSLFVTETGDWAVIQQGMNVESRLARRYHWLSRNVDSFVVEPHDAIVGEKRHKNVLDMTSRMSEECRKTSLDLVVDLKSFRTLFYSIRPSDQKSLSDWIDKDIKRTSTISYASFLPHQINWKALETAYNFSPKNYEELLSFRGVGPATIRGLALVSELVYGNRPSWKDPVKFSYAFGGKDGLPFPVDKKAMDEAIEILKASIESSVEGNERLNALKRLRRFVPRTIELNQD
jgi:hypothetical protein